MVNLKTKIMVSYAVQINFIVVFCVKSTAPVFHGRGIVLRTWFSTYISMFGERLVGSKTVKITVPVSQSLYSKTRIRLPLGGYTVTVCRHVVKCDSPEKYEEVEEWDGVRHLEPLPSGHQVGDGWCQHVPHSPGHHHQEPHSCPVPGGTVLHHCNQENSYVNEVL